MVPVTLQDVARRAGVSISTVSRALHDHARIPPSNRREIQRIAAEMGYRPNPMAVGLVSQREQFRDRSIVGEIAWIHQWTQPTKLRGYREFDAYWRGAFEAAERSGYRLEEFVIGEGMSIPRLANILDARNIQGILLPPHGGAAGRIPDWTNFPWERFSVIRFGYSLPNPLVDVVAPNQIANGISAFSYIHRNGYRRVGFVIVSPTAARFQAGYQLAQTLNGVKTSVPTLALTAARDEAKEQAMLRNWVRKHRPDAIVTDHQPMRRMLEEIGLRVPEDIALVALSVLDGNADAGICQNSHEIGKIAVASLIAAMHTNRRGIPDRYHETLVPGYWQDGGTLPVQQTQGFCAVSSC